MSHQEVRSLDVDVLTWVLQNLVRPDVLFGHVDLSKGQLPQLIVSENGHSLRTCERDVQSLGCLLDSEVSDLVGVGELDPSRLFADELLLACSLVD